MISMPRWNYRLAAMLPLIKVRKDNCVRPEAGHVIDFLIRNDIL